MTRNVIEEETIADIPEEESMLEGGPDYDDEDENFDDLDLPMGNDSRAFSFSKGASMDLQVSGLEARDSSGEIDLDEEADLVESAELEISQSMMATGRSF